MRCLPAIMLAVALGGCGFLDELDFSRSGTLNPHRIYLSPATVVSVASRDTNRYACATPPLVCVQHGMRFDCHCP